MSELAFDANGEPMTFPLHTEELRVRRFRNLGMRGACEVVHDRDGAPLYVPVDIGYVELRNLVDGVPGRYRLDPVDANRRPIADASPAYATFSDVRRSQMRSGLADDRTNSVMSVIGELARANAEMAKTIADRFASVMQAAAELLRAADGAGLPRREPLPATPVQAHDAEDEDDEDADKSNMNVPAEIASLVSQILPTIQLWLSTRAAEKSAAPPVPPVPTSAASPPTPRTAPPVGSIGAVASPASIATGTNPSASSNVFPFPVPDGRPSPVEPISTAQAFAETHTEPPVITPGISVTAGPTHGDGPTRNAGPTIAVTHMAHLMAIHGQLAPDEKRVVQLAVTRMTPDVRAQWLGDISTMTVPQAVTLIRSLIPRIRRARDANGNQDISPEPTAPGPTEDARARPDGARSPLQGDDQE